MNTNKIRKFLLAALLLASCSVPAFGQGFDEDVRQAIQGAMRDVAASIRDSGIPAGAPISCLPLANDRVAYVEGQIKMAVGDAGRQYVEGKTDPFWSAVMEEVAWDTRKADMLDTSTLVAFGKLKATRVLIYGVVRAAEKSGRRVFVEIELHASSIETKQHLWGGNFAKRYYLPGPESIAGLTDIPVEVREPMKAQLAAKVQQSIEQAAGKLSPIKTVAFVPLAGDLDQYATFMLRDAISRGRLTPKSLDLNTLGEARLLLRDQPAQADALLHGAVRDMSQRLESRTFATTTWQVTAEVQACIEQVASNTIPWSDTVTVSERYTKRMTWWEIWTEKIYPYLQAHPLAWIIPLVIMLGLIILAKMIRAGTRVR